jgi:hypothetical protein
MNGPGIAIADTSLRAFLRHPGAAPVAPESRSGSPANTIRQGPGRESPFRARGTAWAVWSAANSAVFKD